MVETLLREDCDAACSIDIAASDGTTPVLATIMWKHADILKVLLDHGANAKAPFEGTKWTPLHAAAMQESEDMCKFLLEHGADPLLEDEHHRRPVDYACVASEAVWKEFEARGCERSSKADLIEKSIIKKVEPELPEEPLRGSAVKVDNSSKSQQPAEQHTESTAIVNDTSQLGFPKLPKRVAKPSMRHLETPKCVSRPDTGNTVASVGSISSSLTGTSNLSSKASSKDSSPTSSPRSALSTPTASTSTLSAPLSSSSSRPFQLPKKEKCSMKASFKSSSGPKLAPAASLDHYSRPGSSYVKHNSDVSGMGMPPAPPSRAGRALAHGQATRKVRRESSGRQSRGSMGQNGPGGSNLMVLT